MPEGTKVDKAYKALKKKGMNSGKAARIAQSQTGLSLQTGKKPKTIKRSTPETMKQFVKRRNKGRNA